MWLQVARLMHAGDAVTESIMFQQKMYAIAHTRLHTYTTHMHYQFSVRAFLPN